MKNLLYFCRVAESILCLLLFFSCSIEEQDGSAGSCDSESLAIIENARTFFETSIIKTRSESAPLFDLGNIVPDWDNAVISDRDSLRAVDVSFRSEYCLKVTRPKVLGDTTKLYNVSAWQKLVILENKETGNRTYAYVTLVPSHDYYRQHKHMDMNTFVQYGDKGDFTGHAIYTDATNNVIFRVNFYIDGVKKCGATILGSKEHQAANIAKMRRMLAGMYFKKKTNILTRSGDEWDIDGGSIEVVPITPPKTDDDPLAGLRPNYPTYEEPDDDKDWDEDWNYNGSIQEPSQADNDKPGILNSVAEKVFTLNGTNLKAADVALLNAYLMNYTACANFQKLFTYISTANRCKIKIDASLKANGSYRPTENIIYIRDMHGAKTKYTLFEEVIHRVQHMYYPNGITKYGRLADGKNMPGFCDIEFEAHVIKAIYDYLETGENTSVNMGNMSKDFNIWLSDVCDNFFGERESIVGRDVYDLFFDGFIRANPTYKGESVSHLQNMEVLMKFIKEYLE